MQDGGKPTITRFRDRLSVSDSLFLRKAKLEIRTRPLFHDLVMTAVQQLILPSPRKAKNQSILDDGFRFFISMRGEMVRAPLSSSLRNERARTFPEFQNHFGARMQTVTTVSCLSCSNTGCSPQTWGQRAHFVAESATLSRDLNGKCGPEILMRHSRHFRKREWF